MPRSLHTIPFRTVAACALLLACALPLVVKGQTAATETTAQPAGTAPRAKSPLVAMYFAPMIFQKITGFFGEIIDVFLNRAKPSAGAASAVASTAGQPKPAVAVQPGQFNMPANTAGMTNAVFLPPPPPIPPNAKEATGVLYAIDRLNADYSIRETITPQPGVPPAFQSREKFAIRYTSNMPGVVVIFNIDALSKLTYLGTFGVHPGTEHRFPAAQNKGMVLDDSVGLETYQMYFMACMPAQLANQPDAAVYKGKVPECGSPEQAEQAIRMAARSRRAKGTYNEALPQADGAEKVVLSVSPYEKGDVTVTTFTINHVASPSDPAPPAVPPAPQPKPEQGVRGLV